MNVPRLLFVVATILFGVGFVLVLVGGADRNTVQELLLLGLVCFAGAHAV